MKYLRTISQTEGTAFRHFAVLLHFRTRANKISNGLYAISCQRKLCHKAITVGMQSSELKLKHFPLGSLNTLPISPLQNGGGQLTALVKHGNVDDGNLLFSAMYRTRLSFPCCWRRITGILLHAKQSKDAQVRKAQNYLYIQYCWRSVY